MQKRLLLRKRTFNGFSHLISASFNLAYFTFKQALDVHDDWEKIYIENMDFEKADQLTNKLIQSFFGKLK